MGGAIAPPGSMLRTAAPQRPRHAGAAGPDGDADRLGFNRRTSQAGSPGFCFYLMRSNEAIQ
jgi:hypothetical protein